MQILLFLLPGSLVFLSSFFENKKASETLVFSLLFSISYYIIAASLSMFVRVPFTLIVYASLLASFIVIIIKRKELGKIVLRRSDRLVLLTLLVVLLLRLLQMFFLIVPSDPSLCSVTYSARTIYVSDVIPWIANGLPGFPALTAALSLVGGSQLYRSSLALSCFSYFIFTAALFLFLVRFFEARVSLFSSIAASSILFGSAVDILSFSLLLAAAALYWEHKKKRDPVTLALIAALVLSALLTSLNITLVYLLAFVAVSAGLVLLPSRIKTSNVFITLLCIVCFSGYLVLYIYSPLANKVFTDYDRDAMRWIDTTIGKNAVFLINDNEAGLWVPALTGRSAITAEGRSKKASYIYLGSRSIGSASIQKNKLEGEPLRYRRVYSNMGGAQIWKVL